MRRKGRGGVEARHLGDLLGTAKSVREKKR